MEAVQYKQVLKQAAKARFWTTIIKNKKDWIKDWIKKVKEIYKENITRFRVKNLGFRLRKSGSDEHSPAHGYISSQFSWFINLWGTRSALQWGREGDAAEKHCVLRVCWQMALASVMVIMAALLRAFVWPWGKLNGSIFVSHTAKWWHSQISIPALSRCSNGRKKADPKQIQFQLVLTEKAGALVKLYTRPKSDYKADFIVVPCFFTSLLIKKQIGFVSLKQQILQRSLKNVILQGGGGYISWAPKLKKWNLGCRD